MMRETAEKSPPRRKRVFKPTESAPVSRMTLRSHAGYAGFACYCGKMGAVRNGAAPPC